MSSEQYAKLLKDSGVNLDWNKEPDQNEKPQLYRAQGRDGQDITQGNMQQSHGMSRGGDSRPRDQTVIASQGEPVNLEGMEKRAQAFIDRAKAANQTGPPSMEQKPANSIAQNAKDAAKGETFDRAPERDHDKEMQR